MSFIKSGIFGAVLGVFLSFGRFLFFIPIIGPLLSIFTLPCICGLNIIAMTIGGYLLCSITNVKKGDYGAAGINLMVYSIVSTFVLITISAILDMFTLGFSAVGGAELLSLGLGATWSILGLITIFFIFLFLTLFFGLIGAIIYLVVKK